MRLNFNVSPVFKYIKKLLKLKLFFYTSLIPDPSFNFLTNS